LDQINAISGPNKQKSRRAVDHMPKQKLDWKLTDAKRLLRAVQKTGLAVKSITKAADGSLTISVAAWSPPELSADVERAIDDATNEWGKAGGVNK
jgi:hypothetical protein